jgi:hypothetical protein
VSPLRGRERHQIFARRSKLIRTNNPISATPMPSLTPYTVSIYLSSWPRLLQLAQIKRDWQLRQPEALQSDGVLFADGDCYCAA